MIVFSIAHVAERSELRIEAPEGCDGLEIHIDAPGAVFRLSPTEADLLNDVLFGFLIDRDRKAAAVSLKSP